MFNVIRAFFLVLLTSSAGTTAAKPSVEHFFKNPEFAGVQLSPSGKYLATLMPINGHRNIVVLETDKLNQPKQLTGLSDQDVAGFFWANDDVVVFQMDEDGAENFGLYAVDRDRKKPRIRTLIEPEISRDGIKFATVVSTLPDDPGHIIVQWNKRRPAYFGLYKVNVNGGVPKLMADKLSDVTGWFVDHNGVARGAYAIEGLNVRLYYRSGEDDEFRVIRESNALEADILPLGFAYDNRTMYVLSNIGHNKAALYTYDPEKNELEDLLFAHDKVDVNGVLMSHERRKLLGATYYDDFPHRHFFDDKERQIFESLDAAFPDKVVNFTSATKDESLYTLFVGNDIDPGNYYLYNRKTNEVRYLLPSRSWIKPEEMSPMKPIRFTARDGMTIPGYVTIPRDRKVGERLPLIVNPHGGPFGVRDTWGYRSEHQFFASRGYAVVQVNFRGSGGYGREFEMAGYGKWGREMQHDISDAVQFMIDEGIADPDRICIYGASYGGYATMAGLTFTPELYKCGINYVGVTDVGLLFDSMPRHWEPQKEVMKEQIGDPKDKEFMNSISPLAHVENIQAPLFIVHGRRDPRVVIEHADDLRKAMRKLDKPFEWMVKANEGHGFQKEENRLELYRRMDKFLEKHL